MREAPAQEVSRTFQALLLALETDTPFTLSRIYELDFPDFEIALEIIESWRLHRYGRSLRRTPRSAVQQLTAS